jgi:hypothetical protein
VQEVTDPADVDPSKEQVEFRNNTAERMPGSNTEFLVKKVYQDIKLSTILCYRQSFS